MSPYRSALHAALGSALFAGIAVGAGDVVLTLAGAERVTTGDAITFATVTLALYAFFAVCLGALEGVVFGALLAGTPGAGTLWRRLREDAELDRRVTGALLAGLVMAAIYAVVVAALALRLVAGVERKAVGALIAGGAAALAVPLFALAAVVPYRLTRRLALIFPRFGSLPRTAVCVVVLVLGGGAAAAFFVATRLDWRVLPLALPATLAAFLALQLLWLVTGRLRPALPALVFPLAIFAVAAGPAAVWMARPSERAAAVLADESNGAKALVGVARRLSDGDRDGFASSLGGGDCDDARADVHPGAQDLPGDGIDQNCVGGDATRGKPPATPTAPASTAAGKFRWEGNVVIIAVDTLRADRLGVAGYLRRGGKSLTPRIDELAKTGVWFTRAYAQSPNTPRSFPSFFLSRYPSQIAWDKPFANYSVVMPENVSVFEVLADAGVHTTGISSHFYFTAERGIRQGFVEYDNEGATNLADSNKDIASPRTVPRVKAKLAELAAAKKRFVLFAHLFEPHSTYMTHPEFPISSRGVEGLEEKYDYEIAFVDKWIGELIDGIGAAGLGENTAIILISDHGEAFGVHTAAGQRMFFHGQTLYDELLRVPLIMRVPGVKPAKIDQPVMLIDLAPTLLDLYKLPAPPSFTGRSLLGSMLGEPLPALPVHGELNPAPSWNHTAKMRISADGKTKVIYRISDNVFERYDLAEDPEERKNLWGRDAATDARVKQEIIGWMESEL